MVQNEKVLISKKELNVLRSSFREALDFIDSLGVREQKKAPRLSKAKKREIEVREIFKNGYKKTKKK